MKIFPQNNNNPFFNAAKNEKTDSNQFGVLLNKQLKDEAFTTLVNDALCNMRPQVLQEIERICDDKSGENIDMAVLTDLLDIYERSML
ncbi:MAG: hypothetical protein LBI27_03490 [Clostridiales bacterium]|jgi:hypothetical protein|nr:hypothetical protein [Clostridiales bacterium]